MALVTAGVGDAETGSTISETSGGGYARVLVNPNGGASPTWDLAAAGLVDNAHRIQFPQATASCGTVVGVAICSAATLGDSLWYGNEMTDRAVDNGDTIEFPFGTLDLQMS